MRVSRNGGLLFSAMFPRTARNRRQAMRHRSNIIQNIYRKILNGNWLGLIADEGISGTDTRK